MGATKRFAATVSLALLIAVEGEARGTPVSVSLYGLTGARAEGLDENVARINNEKNALLGPIGSIRGGGVGLRVRISERLTLSFDRQSSSERSDRLGAGKNCHDFYYECWPDYQYDTYTVTVESHTTQLGVIYWTSVSPRARAGLSASIGSYRSATFYRIDIVGGDFSYWSTEDTSVGVGLAGALDLKILSLLHLEAGAGFREAKTADVDWTGPFVQVGPALYF
jgi:hypothetical protein